MTDHEKKVGVTLIKAAHKPIVELLPSLVAEMSTYSKIAVSRFNLITVSGGQADEPAVEFKALADLRRTALLIGPRRFFGFDQERTALSQELLTIQIATFTNVVVWVFLDGETVTTPLKAFLEKLSHVFLCGGIDNDFIKLRELGVVSPGLTDIQVDLCLWEFGVVIPDPTFPGPHATSNVTSLSAASRLLFGKSKTDSCIPVERGGFTGKFIAYSAYDAILALFTGMIAKLPTEQAALLHTAFVSLDTDEFVGNIAGFVDTKWPANVSFGTRAILVKKTVVSTSQQLATGTVYKRKLPSGPNDASVLKAYVDKYPPANITESYEAIRSLWACTVVFHDVDGHTLYGYGSASSKKIARVRACKLIVDELNIRLLEGRQPVHNPCTRCGVAHPDSHVGFRIVHTPLELQPGDEVVCVDGACFEQVLLFAQHILRVEGRVGVHKRCGTFNGKAFDHSLHPLLLAENGQWVLLRHDEQLDEHYRSTLPSTETGLGQM